MVKTKMKSNSTITQPHYHHSYSRALLESKNVIFRGAPGTGKSYLARQIAADIVSEGKTDDYSRLTGEQKKQIEFVQFHPSYDYCDFVEGLRPIINPDGSMGFELQDGIFKKFVSRARKNYEDSFKSEALLKTESIAQQAITDFLDELDFGVDTFETVTGNKFVVTGVNDTKIRISIPANETSNSLTLSLDNIYKLLVTDKKIEKIKDVTRLFEKKNATQNFSYEFALFKEIKKHMHALLKTKVKREEEKKYVFIIDEINRGEISKILGELFFSLDPGYRGRLGEISTQYSNLHADHNEKFYIPENVYIIGTMNDIDRSVDSFDFAMRRRFRFIEIAAEQHTEMLSLLGSQRLQSKARRRMSRLNRAIAAVEDLNENYQIGAAYFLKLDTLNFDQLWTDYLRPLLAEYVHGLYGEQEIMRTFEQAYGYSQSIQGEE